MPDIRDILKGLSKDDMALYTEIRTAMRRAYLSAHAAVLPITKFEIEDDQFLDLIDIRIALLFDRGGSFNHQSGILDANKAETIETEIKDSFATKMMKEPLKQQTDYRTGQPWPVAQNKVN